MRPPQSRAGAFPTVDTSYIMWANNRLTHLTTPIINPLLSHIAPAPSHTRDLPSPTVPTSFIILILPTPPRDGCGHSPGVQGRLPYHEFQRAVSRRVMVDCRFRAGIPPPKLYRAPSFPTPRHSHAIPALSIIFSSLYFHLHLPRAKHWFSLARTHPRWLVNILVIVLAVVSEINHKQTDRPPLWSQKVSIISTA